MELKPKACEFCGQIFTPHRCVGQRQRACNDEKCKQERKKNSQTQWCKNNPDYFKGRYRELKGKIQTTTENGYSTFICFHRYQLSSL